MAMNDSTATPTGTPPRPATSGVPRSGLPSRAMLPTVLYCAGMIAIFLGERVLDTGRLRPRRACWAWCSCWRPSRRRAVRQAILPEGYRAPERTLLLLYAGRGLVGIGLYFLNSDLLVRLTGRALEQRMPRLSGVLAALWPALWLAGTCRCCSSSCPCSAWPRPDASSWAGCARRCCSGVGIALALVFCFVARLHRDRAGRARGLLLLPDRPSGRVDQEDRARPGQAGGRPPVLPPGQRGARGGGALLLRAVAPVQDAEVQRWDQALHPAKARELGVSANGVDRDGP